MLSWIFNLAMGGGEVDLKDGDTDVDELKVARVNVLSIKSRTDVLLISDAINKLKIRSVS